VLAETTSRIGSHCSQRVLRASFSRHPFIDSQTSTSAIASHVNQSGVVQAARLPTPITVMCSSPIWGVRSRSMFRLRSVAECCNEAPRISASNRDGWRFLEECPCCCHHHCRHCCCYCYLRRTRGGREGWRRARNPAPAVVTEPLTVATWLGRILRLWDEMRGWVRWS